VGEAAPPLLEIPPEQSTDLFYSPPTLQMAALNNIIAYASLSQGGDERSSIPEVKAIWSQLPKAD
jgi:hypothetical protein